MSQTDLYNPEYDPAMKFTKEVDFSTPKRPKLVLFEGCDKVGKTSLFREFRAATHYVPLAIDRFTGSNYVYDKYYGRDVNLAKYLSSELGVQIVFDTYLVVLTARDSVIRERIKTQEEGQALDVALKNFTVVNDLFIDYYDNKTKYQKKMIIDTSNRSVEESLKLILEFTGEVDKR